jgi:hypothetical protein
MYPRHLQGCPTRGRLGLHRRRHIFGELSDACQGTAARRAAAEQRVPGQTEEIEYEDENGNWRRELARGRDRPDTEVEDSP